MKAEVGAEIRLEIGPVAHGGHCVARHEGQVVFVRHAIPGEEVTARITSVGAKFLRADAIEIHRASPDRVTPPCPFSGPDRCGGCDFQHVSLPAQRALKSAVLREQLQRLAGITSDIEVEGIDDDGLAWRTRTTFAVDAEGRLGLRKHRSHEVVALTHCPITVEEINSLEVNGDGLFHQPWASDAAIEAVSTSTGEHAVIVHQDRERHQILGPTLVHEVVGEHRFRVRPDGFWQVHPRAATTLTATVMEMLAPREGEHVLDLFAGVGLFALPIAAAVGAGGRVDAVEGNKRACADAERNLTQYPWANIHVGDVQAVIRQQGWRQCDAIVLDPPRTGAGRELVKALARLRASRIVYVACDPAAFARDVAYFAAAGYRLDRMRAFDLFPMTHHLETVGIFSPGE